MSIDERVAAFADEFRSRAGGDLRVDTYTRILYSTDASLYELMPLAVLIPRSVDEVRAAVSLAADYDIPILPRAAGTSLAGQAVNEALVIDFSRHLDAVVEINSEERWARVQPGIVLDELNRTLQPYGLQFGPDPASSNRSTIGGAVANNATGSHSLLYGMTADHVRAMNVVLATGEQIELGAGSTAGESGTLLRIVNRIADLVANAENQTTIRNGTPRYWRRCGGYNLDRLLPEKGGTLAHLVCGSEGTLALMTEITVHLVPLPLTSGLALLQFDSLDLALRAVPAILETGPAAVELLDTLSLTLCRDVPEYARLLASVVEGRPNCLLVVEFLGENEREVKGAIARLECVTRSGEVGATALTPALTSAAQSAVWRVRKAGLGLLMSMKGDMKPVPMIEDAAVPVEYLPEYVRQIEEYCAGLDTPVTYYAHAGAGCLHIRPLINRRSAAQLARMPDIARFAAGLVKGYGGAISSEHGDGRSRSWLNEEFYGRELYALYREVKRIFDPTNLLNPGIIVDSSPMTSHLRRLPEIAAPSRSNFDDYNHDTPLEFRVASRPSNNNSHTKGLVRAIEMCNGAGVCRQRISGTMCPSFMVTREEMHSTRGRANALRATMTGALPAGEMTSNQMYEIMDLCISCKACKAECPSAVDMARLKMEFLAQYHDAHGVSIRARFFAHSASLARLGSGPIAPVANALLGSAVGRRLAASILGMAPQRTLPPVARHPFSSWWRHQNPVESGNGRRGELVLVIDPFTNLNYPEIAIAAVEFFRAAGWQIVAAPVVNDGRTFISAGLLAAARRAAERAAATLFPWAEKGLPLVGLEPSALLTLRDEVYHLLPGDSRVPLIAGLAQTFEEFVAERAGMGHLEVRFTDASRRILLHGHCHQKALIGTAPAQRALSLPPGFTVEEIDSGCCGMAGAFGYEAEHYDISMRMAERRLLPAVRAVPEDTIIAAAGMSCRQQIAHGSGRQALHPAQILRDALSAGDAPRPF